MSPDTLHGMRREALRRRPELCPARFLISLHVEKTHPKPSLCSGSAGNSPGRSGCTQGHAYCGLGASDGWTRPGETGWRGTAQGPQKMPAKSLCHHSHQRNTLGQLCRPTTPLISKDCLPSASLFKEQKGPESHRVPYYAFFALGPTHKRHQSSYFTA